jgi:CheY-like chemotaxis protein
MGSACTGRLILLIDDDPEFLNSLTQDLTSAGHRVLQAAEGQEGMDLLEKLGGEVDLVITDLALPGMSGYEVISQLSHGRKDLRVIAVSGVYKESYLEVATVLGARAALQKTPRGKPMQRAQWLAAVESVFESSASANN